MIWGIVALLAVAGLSVLAGHFMKPKEYRDYRRGNTSTKR